MASSESVDPWACEACTYQHVEPFEVCLTMCKICRRPRRIRNHRIQAPQPPCYGAPLSVNQHPLYASPRPQVRPPVPTAPPAMVGNQHQPVLAEPSLPGYSSPRPAIGVGVGPVQPWSPSHPNDRAQWPEVAKTVVPLVRGGQDGGAPGPLRQQMARIVASPPAGRRGAASAGPGLRRSVSTAHRGKQPTAAQLHIEQPTQPSAITPPPATLAPAWAGGSPTRSRVRTNDAPRVPPVGAQQQQSSSDPIPIPHSNDLPHHQTRGTAHQQLQRCPTLDVIATTPPGPAQLKQMWQLQATVVHTYTARPGTSEISVSSGAAVRPLEWSLDGAWVRVERDVRQHRHIFFCLDRFSPISQPHPTRHTPRDTLYLASMLDLLEFWLVLAI